VARWVANMPREEWRGLTACARRNKAREEWRVRDVIKFVMNFEWRGLTAFARRNKACVVHKLISGILSVNVSFLPNILELVLSPEKTTQIKGNVKIQNTPFLYIKFPTLMLSPVHSTRGNVTEARLE